MQVLWQRKIHVRDLSPPQPCAWLPMLLEQTGVSVRAGMSFRVTVTATNGLPLERPTPSTLMLLVCAGACACTRWNPRLQPRVHSNEQIRRHRQNGVFSTTYAHLYVTRVRCSVVRCGAVHHTSSCTPDPKGQVVPNHDHGSAKRGLKDRSCMS